MPYLTVLRNRSISGSGSISTWLPKIW